MRATARRECCCGPAQQAGKKNQTHTTAATPNEVKTQERSRDSHPTKEKEVDRYNKGERREVLTIPTSSAAVACGLLRVELSGIDGGGTGLLIDIEFLQSDFGGILFGIVDVLAVVPIARRVRFALDGDVTRPGSSASYISDTRAISIRCQSSELKVGVQWFLFCSSTLLFLQYRDTSRGRARE
jgi:hypothetical protein